MRNLVIGAVCGFAVGAYMSRPEEETFDPVKSVAQVLRWEKRRREQGGGRSQSRRRSSNINNLLDRLGSVVEDGSAMAQAAMLCVNCTVRFEPYVVGTLAIVDMADGSSVAFLGMFNSWYCISQLAANVGDKLAEYVEDYIASIQQGHSAGGDGGSIGRTSAAVGGAPNASSRGGGDDGDAHKSLPQ